MCLYLLTISTDIASFPRPPPVSVSHPRYLAMAFDVFPLAWCRHKCHHCPQLQTQMSPLSTAPATQYTDIGTDAYNRNTSSLGPKLLDCSFGNGGVDLFVNIITHSVTKVASEHLLHSVPFAVNSVNYIQIFIVYNATFAQHSSGIAQSV
jgi:hypothetical protein